jgi:hypothetical protein
LAANARLREAFEWIQKTDAAIGRAVRDVPVPEGLADLLLVRLAEARQVEATRALANTAVAETAIAETAGRRFDRRSIVLGVASFVAAAAILLAFLLTLRPRAYSLAEIQSQAMAQFQADLEQKPLGRLVSSSPPSEAFPMSRDVAANSGMRWRSVPGLLGGRAIAYDLTLPDGTRATLYVVRPRAGVPPLPGSPPSIPTPMTQRRSLAAWKIATPSGNVLYVLAVDGGASSYRGLLRVARMPVA